MSATSILWISNGVDEGKSCWSVSGGRRRLESGLVGSGDGTAGLLVVELVEIQGSRCSVSVS